MPDDDQTADAPGEDEGGTSTSAAVDTAGDEQRRGKEMQTAKRRAILDDLLTKLDYAVYAHLAALYYMDCSFFQFLLRGLVQLVFLTPKDHVFGEAPRHQPYIGAILGTNILCIILHVISKRPEAGEAMRGYMHGGIFIDFVGEKGPIPKTRLVLFDILTVVLQVVMLGVLMESQTLKTPSSSPSAPTETEAQTGTAQDHDSEERGIHRADTTPIISQYDATADDIELQPLGRSGTGRTGGEEDGERDELLAEPSNTRNSADLHPLDSFYTGGVVIADLHLIDTIRNQWWQYQTATASTATTTPPDEPSTRYFHFPGGRLAIRMRARGERPGAT